MKPISLFTERIPSDTKEKNPEKYDLLMHTIKAVHSAFVNPLAVTPEDLARQRAGTERFSKLITPPVGLHVTEFSVDNIPCEWIKPEFAHRTDKLILHCHGGGYTSGGLGYARILASKLALHTGIEVVTFEYGLSPENPFPGPLNDAMKVWDRLMHLGYGASNILISGDSAGGNMALELCLRLRSDKRQLPGAMIMFSPWTDMRAVNPSYESNKEKDPTLTREYVLSVRTAYAGKDADFEAPELSPLLADLEGMPPALIQVGSNEILRDDSEKLAKKLSKSGSYAKLEIYAGGWHVFQQMPVPRALHAISAVKAFTDSVI